MLSVFTVRPISGDILAHGAFTTNSSSSIRWGRDAVPMNDDFAEHNLLSVVMSMGGRGECRILVGGSCVSVDWVQLLQ